jgi:hypothetical protein
MSRVPSSWMIVNDLRKGHPGGWFAASAGGGIVEMAA